MEYVEGWVFIFWCFLFLISEINFLVIDNVIIFRVEFWIVRNLIYNVKIVLDKYVKFWK